MVTLMVSTRTVSSKLSVKVPVFISRSNASSLGEVVSLI